MCGDVHPCPGPGQSIKNNSRGSRSSFNFTTDFKNFQKRGLHFIHINVRSLLPKLHEVTLLATNTKATCICVTETWLDDSVPDSEIQIDNYCILRKDRNRRGGGVCVYIRKDFSFNQRCDLDNSNLEAVWFEILLPKTRPILCGSLYRPPSQHNFYSVLDSVCSSNNDFTELETILLGDFNTDVSSEQSCTIFQNFKNFTQMFNFKQLIAEATRICKSTSTTIDLILVSDPDKISQSGVIHTCFSDHRLIYCTRKISKSFVGQHNTVNVRSMKNYSIENLHDALLAEDWSQVFLSDDVNTAWNIFKDIFSSVLDNIVPFKQIRLKQRSEPWMDSDILETIQERDKAFHKYKQNKSEGFFNTFKTLRNKVQYLVHNAKIIFFSSSIEENKHDSKSLWKILKTLGLPSRKGSNTSGPNICLNIDDSVSFDKGLIAETFNNFYTTVASKLVEQLPTCIGTYSDKFVKAFYQKLGIRLNNYSFTLVSEIKVLQYLCNLGPNKATGLDGLPSKFVKDAAPIIVGPFTHIVNLSLIHGMVPDELKNARVVPLFKKNDRLSVGNYRPVSILNVFSKILEKVVFDQVDTYFKDNHLFYEFQSGFRRGFSTDTCLIYLTDFIKLEIDKGNVVGMVLLDLQKAFDTVNHSILLMKLKACGLGNDICNWFASYLTDRQQLVDVSGIFSSKATITCGVPQGSILGPLLFLIYVNDMPAAAKSKILLYADDSAILASGKTVSEVEKALSDDLQAVSDWLVDNKLSLHLGKTESIVFGSRHKLKSQPKLNISCNGTPISQTDSVKYLGVTIDQFLSFKSMAESVLTKVNARLKFLIRKRDYLNFYTKKLLVMSLIQCHYDYACSVWYTGLTKNLKNKLQITQNKIVRFIFELDARSHVSIDHFKHLNWLPVQSRVEQIMLCHVFKINRNVAPEYLKIFFTSQDTLHNYNTRLRSKGGYCIPKVKSLGAISFSFNSAKLWNDIAFNSNVVNTGTYYSFRIAVKDVLFSRLSF